MTAGLPAYAVAFGGGVISFLSPCVLPLVPAYLSLVTGLEVSQIDGDRRRHALRITTDTGLFVAGFAVVFVILGLSADALGRAAFSEHALLTQISGGIVLAMAIFLAGSLVLRAPRLYSERRFYPQLGRYGRFAAPLAGAAFGFGWTPCIGPVLASILTVASTEDNVWRGGLLLVAYSVGMGACFLAAGLAAGRLSGAFGWVKRHFAGITLGAALVMAVFGVLLVFNRLAWLTAELGIGLDHIGLARLTKLG